MDAPASLSLQVQDLGTTSLCELWLELWYQGKVASPLLYVSQVLQKSVLYEILQKKVVLVFFHVFFAGHFASSGTFTDDGGVGWQLQKYESMHPKEMDKTLWYEHPSQKSF